MISLLSVLVSGLAALSIAWADIPSGYLPEAIVPPGFNHNGRATPLTQDQAQAWFRYFAERADIPFRFPDDGCNARAHKMARVMEANHVLSLKLFMTAPDGSYFRVPTGFHPDGYVDWNYHVAPAVLVKSWKDGKPAYRFWVLDPSIMVRAVPADDWLHFISKSNGSRFTPDYFPRFVYRTDRGNPGYWLQVDLEEMERTLQEGLALQAARGHLVSHVIYSNSTLREIHETVKWVQSTEDGIRVSFTGRAGVYRVDEASPRFGETLAALLKGYATGAKVTAGLDQGQMLVRIADSPK